MSSWSATVQSLHWKGAHVCRFCTMKPDFFPPLLQWDWMQHLMTMTMKIVRGARSTQKEHLRRQSIQCTVWDISSFTRRRIVVPPSHIATTVHISARRASCRVNILLKCNLSSFLISIQHSCTRTNKNTDWKNQFSSSFVVPIALALSLESLLILLDTSTVKHSART